MPIEIDRDLSQKFSVKKIPPKKTRENEIALRFLLFSYKHNFIAIKQNKNYSCQNVLNMKG